MTLTDREMIERAALLAAVEATSHDAIVAISDRGLILSFNPAAERLFGLTEDEARGRNVKMLMPQPYQHDHDGYMARYLATGEKRIIGIGRIVSGLRRDGSTFPMELAVGEARIAERPMFVGFVRDLSQIEREHRRVAELQSELFHVSRLGEMGQMAAGLAHEVNQPLAAIMNYTEAGRQMLGLDAREATIRDILDKIEKQAARAAEIIRRLRAFIEKRDVERCDQNLNGLIEEALALALVGAKARDVRAKLDLALKTPPVHVDGVQIQQVLVNLMRNAMDATENQVRREMWVHSSLAPDGFVTVTVGDNGPGVDPGVAKRLFEAFVTTKRVGMGVGLAIARQIVEAHGGRIWAEPSTGGGAKFSFTLPLAACAQAKGAGLE